MRFYLRCLLPRVFQTPPVTSVVKSKDVGALSPQMVSSPTVLHAVHSQTHWNLHSASVLVLIPVRTNAPENPSHMTTRVYWARWCKQEAFGC